jgi:hypothetical protein
MQRGLVAATPRQLPRLFAEREGRTKVTAKGRAGGFEPHEMPVRNGLL